MQQSENFVLMVAAFIAEIIATIATIFTWLAVRRTQKIRKARSRILEYFDRNEPTISFDDVSKKIDGKYDKQLLEELAECFPNEFKSEIRDESGRRQPVLTRVVSQPLPDSKPSAGRMQDSAQSEEPKKQPEE